MTTSSTRAAPTGSWLGRTYLWLELTALFVAVPIYLVAIRHSMNGRIIQTLVLVAIFCGVVLAIDPRFRGGFAKMPSRADVLRVMKTFLPGAALLGVAVALLQPELLFSFPRQNPNVWLAVMVLYPLLSVYPQEIIFRAFMFHRYERLFGDGLRLVVVSAVAFGAAHLFFGNWVAPVLTTLGGYLFARTYARSGSVVLASIEHALWGDLVFTLGIGVYFYGGAIQ